MGQTRAQWTRYPAGPAPRVGVTGARRRASLYGTQWCVAIAELAAGLPDPAPIPEAASIRLEIRRQASALLRRQI